MCILKFFVIVDFVTKVYLINFILVNKVKYPIVITENMSENNKEEKDEKIHTINDPFENGKKVIFVNKKEIPVKEDSLTGKQILENTNFDVDKYDLFLIRGQDSEKIKLEQTVPIKSVLHFHVILKDAPYG